MNSIDRRTLLQAAVGGVFASHSLASAVPFHNLSRAAAMSPRRSDDKILLVFLRGGLDGVSAVVPVRDTTYLAQRSVGGVPLVDPANTTNLNGFAFLNNRMSILLGPSGPWASGELAFVHQVGNPGGSRSHFTEMVRYESGDTNSSQVLDPEGWVPRLLSTAGVTSPVGGATISGLVQRLFQSSSNPMLHVRDVAAFQSAAYNQRLKDHLAQPVPLDPVEQRVQRIGDRMVQAQQLVDASPNLVHDPVLYPQNQGEWPAPTLLVPSGAAFLRSLEGAMHLLLNTDCCIAGVEMGGFDTHNDQAAELEPLLEALAYGMNSSWLAANGAIKLTTVVMSEFGRTAKANGNLGTDHGIGGLMMLLGPKVVGGVYNCSSSTWTPLTTQFNSLGNATPVATHFLAIFRELIEKRFGITNATQLNMLLPGLTGPGVGPNINVFSQ